MSKLKKSKSGAKKKPDNEKKAPLTVYIKKDIIIQNFSLSGGEDKCKGDVIEFLHDRVNDKNAPPKGTKHTKAKPSKKSELKKDKRVPKSDMVAPEIKKVNLAEAFKNV